MGTDRTSARRIICNDPSVSSEGGAEWAVCPLREEGGPCRRLNRCIIGRPNLAFDDADSPHDRFYDRFEGVNLHFGGERTPGVWVAWGALIGIGVIAAFLVFYALMAQLNG